MSDKAIRAKPEQSQTDIVLSNNGCVCTENQSLSPAYYLRLLCTFSQNKMNKKMKKIGILLLSVVASSCTDALDMFGYSEMTVNITNNSEMTIKKAGFYAQNGGDPRTPIFVDSFFVENIPAGSSKQLIAKESRKLMAKDGSFTLRVTFENGEVKVAGCCYFSNGQFQNTAIDFEVKKDTILQK